MKIVPILSAYLVITTSALAAGPATNAAPLHPDRPKTNGTTVEGKPAPNAPDRSPLFSGAPSPAPAPVPPVMNLDDYINELATSLKLSPDDKADVKSYYLADGPAMDKVLNDETLSPLQQDQQISDLRNSRNAKIEALLQDAYRQQKFLQIEAKYRVALVELAADNGLLPPGTPTPVPAVIAPTETTPAKAEEKSPVANPAD